MNYFYKFSWITLCEISIGKNEQMQSYSVLTACNIKTHIKCKSQSTFFYASLVCVESVVYLCRCHSAIRWRTAQVLFPLSWGRYLPGMCQTVNKEMPHTVNSYFTDLISQLII